MKGRFLKGGLVKVKGTVRYVASDAARSQRWAAPLLLFAAAVAIANSEAGPLLTTYADTASCLMPIAVWLTRVVVNAEDPVQTDVSIVTVGSDSLFRIGKLLTAFCACVALSGLAVLTPLLVHDYPSAKATEVAIDVAAGLAGHLLVALFGVAAGALVSRPVIRRAAWAVLVATGACLAEIVIPHAPPTRQVLALFDQDHPSGLAASLATNAAETVALAVAAITVALGIARRRT